MGASLNRRHGVAFLATSAADISRARAVLKSLSQPGVLDELGYLVLQTAFADRLYPATNTIMTRARYLVFVPAIYRYLEQRGKTLHKDVDRIVRDVQDELRKVLVTHGTAGVIGADSKRNVIRPPSAVYWNALADLGIATRRVSESSYQAQLSNGGNGERGVRDDDDAVHADHEAQFWDPTFPTKHVLPPEGTFPTNTTLQLRRSEARQLQQRHAKLLPSGGESLIAHLVAHGERQGAKIVAELPFPWSAPDLPDPLSSIVMHARCLSLFARGTVLQYHRMLIERRAVPDPGVLDAFERWRNLALAPLRNWNLDAFLSVAIQLRGLRGGDTKFITEWHERVLSTPSGKALLNDNRARGLIEWREHAMRRGKARLQSKYHLELWTPPVNYLNDSGYQLFYRHRTGHQFAKDILEGLTRGNE
jgi:hypothetical protein